MSSAPTDLPGELLALVPRLRQSDREVERAAGLPERFLSRGRQGSGRGVQAAASWEGLARLLVQRLGAEAVLAACPRLGTQPQADATAAKPESAAGSRVREVLERARAAGLDELERLLGELIVFVGTGDLAPSVGSVVVALGRERRQVLLALAEERRRGADGRPVIVRVVYENHWQQSVLDAQAEDELAREHG